MKFISSLSRLGPLWLGAWLLLAGPPDMLRADDIAAGMRESGVASYMEKLIETSANLKAAIPTDLRTKMLGQFGVLKEKTEHSFNVKTSQPLHALQLDMALADFVEIALLVSVMQTVSDGKTDPFSLAYVLFPSDAFQSVQVLFPILPDFEPGKAQIELGQKSLEIALRAGDWREFYKNTETASHKTGKAPQFLQEWLDQARANASRDNGLFKTLDIRPQASYVCSKSVAENAFVSLFSGMSAQVPGVYLVLFYVDDKQPMVANLQIIFGMQALPYLAEVGRREKLSARK
jgi:hypothetical protein